MGNIVVAVLYHQSILGRSIELTTTTYIHKYSDLLSSFSVVFLRFANRRCRMDGCTNPIQRTTKQTFSLTTTLRCVQVCFVLLLWHHQSIIINQSSSFSIFMPPPLVSPLFVVLLLFRQSLANIIIMAT